MKKPVDFSTYKMVRNLSFNDFNKWVISIYNTGYQDGLNDQEYDVELSDDELLDIILSVKGIGKTRATAVVESVMRYGSET
jgi:hypothetical protein